jgi:membrane-bound lytic murein transglycosylase B
VALIQAEVFPSLIDSLKLAIMNMRLLWVFSVTLPLSAFLGCSQHVSQVGSGPVPVPVSPVKPVTRDVAGDAGGNYHAQRLSGDFAGYPAAERFVDKMVAQHGFSREYLYGLLSQAQRKEWTIEYMNKEKPTTKPKPGGWTRYRAKFLDDRHISAGASFWARHASALERASQQYGVSPEHILGIMGVETIYGANLGNHRIIDALSTLAFDYPRRAEYFESELESLLIMSRNERQDPSRPKGSFAGAMGLGQFMPSSFLKYAVDFNGDGLKDLWDPEDAIGSIANYFSEFGWRPGEPVVSPAEVQGNQIEGLTAGFDTKYSLPTLASYGVRPTLNFPADEVSLLKLSVTNGDDYYVGYPNFYVITRYNHSTYYAMAVHQLGQAIKQRYQGR